MAVESASDLAFDALESTGDLRLRSRFGDIAGGALRAGGNAEVRASGSVRVDDSVVGDDHAIDAGHDVHLGRYGVGGSTMLVSGGEIEVGAGAGAGHQQLRAAGGIRFGSVAGGTTIDMRALGGDIEGTHLEAAEAHVSARDRIGIDMARIGSRLNLAAAEIDGRVEHTPNRGDPLSMVLTGYQDGVARKIALSVDARDGWIVDRLAAMQAELDTSAATVEIRDGHIARSMQLTTPVTRTWMHNQDPAIRPADVQLVQPGGTFVMSQRGALTFTDAYVVRYGEGYHVQVPNHLPSREWTDVDYYAESALRFTVRTLQASAWTEPGPARHQLVGWRDEPALHDEPVERVSGAVNTGISP